MYSGHATWQLRTGDRRKEETLREALGISKILARILVSRGIDTPGAAEEFFDLRWERVPSPWLLADMKPAAARLAQAVRDREIVTIYGDYDVDGVTATALLVHVIQDLGGKATYYIPRRTEEGYGLHSEALEEIRAESPLVVTVDCGITALSEAESALDDGLDLIITDHHQPIDRLPKALAVVNPNRDDCQYPTRELAGVGVAFKLAHALALTVTEDAATAEEIVLRYVDLVALGTVADVVPLKGENRILVHIGLERFAESSVGLSALLEVAHMEKTRLSPGNLAFGLAPRINALGRLDDAAAGVRLLLTKDSDEAGQLAKMLDATNRERQAIEAGVVEEAVARVESEVDLAAEWSIVLASPTWHPGVIGIAASRLVERYHRPTILISLAEGMGKGSGRSIEGFDMHGALQSLSPLMERFGGHKMAAGLTIREELIPKLRQDLNELARARLTKTDLIPTLQVDAEVALDEVDQDLLAELRRLEPYGVGNPQPVLMASSLSLQRGFLVGKTRSHLKLLVSKGGTSRDGTPYEAIGFRMAERLSSVAGVAQVDLVFQPQLNVWNGRTSIDLVLKDLRVPMEEARQQHLRRSVTHYRQLVDKLGRWAWQQLCSDWRPAAYQREVVDWRGDPDKGSKVDGLLAMGGTTLFYVAKPRYAMALAERLSQTESLRGRVGLYYGRMPTEERAFLQTALEEGSLVLVVTAEPMTEHLEQYFDRLVLYHLPVTPAEFRSVWGFGSRKLYLVYTAKDVNRNQKFWSQLYPGREELVQLYLALGRAGSSSQAVEVSSKWSIRSRVPLDWGGVCRGLRVFSELKLVTLDGPASWEKAGSVWVKLLPSPKNKLDLTRSISYNECVKLRDYLDRYGHWALRTPISEFQGQEAWDKVLGA